MHDPKGNLRILQKDYIYNARMRNGYSHFFAENSIQKLPAFEEIKARHPELRWIESYQTFRNRGLAEEKNCLIYARKRGAWLKPFHCYHHNSEFEYYSLDVAEGCPFDCVYCYLQSYLNHGALVLFVNLEDLKLELQQFRQEQLWISTGLLTDSLICEKYFSILPEISPFLPAGSILELRTKSADVSILDRSEISRDQVVISWSLNPPIIADHYEYRASDLTSRLKGAQQAINLGYRVGFHLDPVFYFDGWREAYQGLLEKIHEFPLNKVAFLSVGLFRYMPDLGAIIRKRFPLHPILSAEFLPDEDGKYHYFREIRKDMYQTFSGWMAPWKKTVPIFWSMEPDERLITHGSGGSETGPGN